MTFKTNHEGISHILDTFGGKDFLTEDFPNPVNNPFEWRMMDLLDVYSLQKELGVVLFDNNLNDLIERIKSDDLEYVKTKRYPEDAVPVWYLEFRKRHSASYNILILKDLGLVYIRIAEDL